MKMVMLFVSVLFWPAFSNAQINLENASNKQMVMTNMSSMPLAFTQNQGQFGDKTLFKANAGGATFYFCNDEVAYLFVRDTDELLEDELYLTRDPAGKIYNIQNIEKLDLFEQTICDVDPKIVIENALKRREQRKQRYLNKTDNSSEPQC